MTNFRKSVVNIQVSLKSEKNNWHFTRRPTYVFDHTSLNSYQNEKYFKTKVVEKIKTKISRSILFFSENRDDNDSDDDDNDEDDDDDDDDDDDNNNNNNNNNNGGLHTYFGKY